MSSFNKNLKNIMKSKNLTADWIAKQMDVSASTVTHWSNGRRFPSNEDYIQSLAKILQVNISSLFAETTEIIYSDEKIVFNALQNPTKNIKKIIEDYNHSHGFIRGDIIGDGSNNGHTINNHSHKTFDPLTDKLVDIFNSLDEEKKERIFLDVLQYKYSG